LTAGPLLTLRSLTSQKKLEVNFRGGQSYFKNNGDEALSDEFLLKSNGNEALSNEFLLKSNGDEALNDVFP
jgi:hypothetical protein